MIAETTHFRFTVSISTGSGFQYRGLSISRLAEGTDKYGHRNIEWRMDADTYGLSEQDQNRLREAIHELEAEQDAVSRYAKMTDEQRTLSEIWHRMCEAERTANSLKHRLEEAESVVAKLRGLWYKMEEKADENI